MTVSESHTTARMGGVLRQSAVLFGGNVLLMAGGYGFKVYLARTVGAEGLGLFTIADSLISFALVLVVFEMQQAVFRFIPQFKGEGNTERLSRLIWASIWHVSLFGVIGAVIIFLTRSFWAGTVFHNNVLEGVLFFFALMLPFRALEMVIRLISRAYKEVLRVTVIQTFIVFPFKVCLSIILITAGLGLSGWLWGELVAITLSVILLSWLAFHLSPKAVRTPSFVIIQEPLVYAFLGVMVGRAFLGIGSAKVGSLLLGVFLDPKAVGIYSIALTTVALMTMLQSALNGVFAPHITELHVSGKKKELAEMFYRVTRWNLLATLPVFSILIFMSGPLMSIFGPEFRGGAVVLCILSMGELVNIGTGPVGTLLNMTGHERLILWTLIGQFLFITLLLIILLPAIGLAGAAIAQSSGTVFLYILLFRYAKKHFPVYILTSDTLKILVSAVVLSFLTWAISSVLGPFIAPALLLVITFVVIYALWGSWVLWRLSDLKDKEFAREAIRGIKARFTGAA